MAKQTTLTPEKAKQLVEKWRDDVMSVAKWLQNEEERLVRALARDPEWRTEMEQLTNDQFSLVDAVLDEQKAIDKAEGKP
jgi:monoamine oxidase